MPERRILGILALATGPNDVYKINNIHYFHRIGDGHQPNSRGLYI